jgi:hypothetical protein
VCFVGRTSGRVESNEGDEGEGMWWVGFIYLYEMEKTNLLKLL